MQQPQDKSQDVSAFSISDSFNVIYGLSSAYSICVLPFLRTGMGSHAFGMNAVFGLVLMFTVGGLQNAPVMVNFIGIWVLAVILQRITGHWLRSRRREPVHSQYLGDPWLARIPGINGNAARGIVEPFLTFWIGAGVGALSRPVGGFLMGAAVALFLKNIIDLEIDRARARRMRDAHIEQTYISRRYRQGN